MAGITGIAKRACGAGFAALAFTSAFAADVWTHRYDNGRTGANVAEVQLTTSNVNPAQFGKLFSYPVDGDIYTQPLVIGNVPIATTSGGVTFRFEGGIPVKSSLSLGPIFAERAQTLGRGRR